MIPNGHMEKQEMEMETEMETEMENWNGNSCTVVSNHWTELTQTPTFSVGQKLNLLIQPITCSWAWSGILPRVSRGQRSHASLISCDVEEHLHDLFWTETNSQPWLKHIEQNCHQLWPWSLFVKAYQICTWPLTYTDSGKTSRHI